MGKQVAVISILMIGLAVFFLKRSKSAAPGERHGQKTRLLDCRENAGLAIPRRLPLFDRNDTRIDRFLQENQESAAAVLAVYYLLHDKEILNRHKEAFQDDPAFAVHYLSVFPDDPDIGKWLDTLLREAPENACGHYLGILDEINHHSGPVSSVINRLKDTVALTDFDDYGVEIENAAFSFFTDYLDLDIRDALRLSVWEYSFTPATGGFGDIHDFINEHLSEAKPQERINMGSAGFNIGTNLVSTGDPLMMALGLGLEGLYYRVLSDTGESSFNVSPEDVLSQIDDDRALMQMMLKSAPPDFENLSEAQLKTFRQLRQTEGRVASFFYLEDLRSR